MADLSSIAKYITPGKEATAEKIAKAGGTTIYGGSSGSKSTKAQDAAYGELMKQIQGGATATSGKALDVGAITSAYTGAGGKITSDQQKILDTITKGTAVNTSMLNNPVKPVTLPQAETSPFSSVPITPVTPTETKNEDGYSKLFTEAMKLEEKNKAPSLYDEYLKQEKTSGIKDLRQQEVDLTTEINTIVAQQQADVLQARNQASAEGGTAGILSAREDAVNRSAAIKVLPLQAKLAGVQGNIELAKDRLNTLFDLKKEDIKNTKAQKDRIIDLFVGLGTKAQDARLEDRRILEKRASDKEIRNIEYLRDLSIQESKNGNHTLAAQLATLESKVGSADFDSLVAEKMKNYGGTVGSAEIDRVIDINGVQTPVDKYGNVISIKGGAQTGSEQIQKSLDQFKFLRDTITDAKELSDAAGPNLITQGIGNVFVGNTSVKQLQKKIDTLKVNLLTLNTDPAVKKFFGPQMTERDTELMTSAGTTMDAYVNSPEDLKDELDRYDDLINRMQTAVKLGNTSSGANIMTAPDGTLIQIID